MMEQLTVDVLVIGFGKAGKTIAMKRAAAGDRVALVEQNPAMYGGTCINIGCVPTKFLLEQAHSHREFTRARDARNTFIDRLNAANQKMVEGKGVLLLDGAARFLDSSTVQVGEQVQVSASTIIINTGASSGVEVGGRLHDSTSIQQLESTPASLAIVGGGPIGLEFATMFSGFGSRVTIYKGEGDFLPALDRHIAQAVREHLEKQGINIVDQRIAVEQASEQLDDEAILVAIGRRPVVAGLDLEAAGVKYTEKGIEVDEHCRTSVEGIYAVGDVTGAPQFTYASYDDHRIVLSDRWGDGSRTRTGRLLPTTTFIDPPLSTVGLTAEAAGRDYKVEVRESKIADLAIVPRPKIMGQPEGIAQFVLDQETNQILGATLWCIDSQELINTVALAMTQKIPAAAVGEGIYTHPSTSEVFNALLA
ncbi:FAD-dependent oxidoreductase [Rothia nasimurium]|uniref:FAD-dependent oxidoreductase n=1 Tax=Rothia nasimurium TaxID=85336 RepID=UPI001F40E963|nr:FAD-dependent oxidoreductase [Rothia nasimurium]